MNGWARLRLVIGISLWVLAWLTGGVLRASSLPGSPILTVSAVYLGGAIVSGLLLMVAYLAIRGVYRWVKAGFESQ